MSEFAHSAKSDTAPSTTKLPKKSTISKNPTVAGGMTIMKHKVKSNFNRVIVKYSGDLEKEPKNEYTHEPIADPHKIASELLFLGN